MYRLDLSTSVKVAQNFALNDDYREDLKEVKRLGFKAVEVSMGGFGNYKMSMEKAFEVAADRLQAVLDEGLTLNSVHLPFHRFVYISSCDEDVRAWASDEFRKLMDICNPFQPKNYVFHSKVGKKEGNVWQQRKPALIKSFRELVAATDANVCMENMVSGYPATIEDMVEVLEQVEGAKCCIDINHFLTDKPEDGIVALSKWLTTLHITDNDGVYERHWMPKTGVNDWMKILGALEKIGYKGAFTYEVIKDPTGRPYTFAEIRENYDQLFEEYNQLRSH